ncbi:MAG: hypothetical protein AB7U45_00590 [Desulfamplus sp.]
MKKLLLRVLLLALLLIPFPTMAEVRVGISISMPPLIVFDEPPELIVLPETYVYVVPNIDEDIFFYDGWWWRQWEGSWYRSRDYSSGWANYTEVPSFYMEIPPGWRYEYEEEHWRGYRWKPKTISYEQVSRNWKGWEKSSYWEEQTWHVEGLEYTKMKRRTDSGITISSSSLEPIVFVSPPKLIVVPETNIYVIPSVAVDIFFYSGWWWRPSEGHWYRSRSYNSGWVGYSSVPSFYREIPTDWRNQYRTERWRGHQWKPELIPHEQVQESWSRWEKTNHWENERTWGIENMESVRRLKHKSINVQQGTRSQQQSIGTRLKHQSIDARQQQSRQQVNKVKKEQLHQKQTEKKSQKVKQEQLQQQQSNNKQRGNNKQHENNGNNKQHQNNGKNKQHENNGNNKQHENSGKNK